MSFCRKLAAPSCLVAFFSNLVAPAKRTAHSDKSYIAGSVVRNRQIAAVANYVGLIVRVTSTLLLVMPIGACSNRPPSRTLYWKTETIRIEVNGPTTARLAELSPKLAQSVLIFRGHLRAENLNGHASLSIRCDVPGHTEILSGAKEVTGTTGSISQVLRFTAAPASMVRSVTLNVVAEGVGVVWIGPIALFGQ